MRAYQTGMAAGSRLSDSIYGALMLDPAPNRIIDAPTVAGFTVCS
jgi:hypothetical protein